MGGNRLVLQKEIVQVLIGSIHTHRPEISLEFKTINVSSRKLNDQLFECEENVFFLIFEPQARFQTS